MRKLKALLVVLVAVAACTKEPKTDKEKYSYAIGYQFAKNLQMQNVDVDADALAVALHDVIENKKPVLNQEQMQASLQKMYESRSAKMAAEADANKKKAQDFLEKNKKAEGVKVTETGLQYKIVQEGSGPSPKKNDIVVVNYKGNLLDDKGGPNGPEFDSSYKQGKPIEFQVDGVIPGWTEALQKMKKDAKWILYIPPELAYGDRGSRETIKPNSLLIFEVELKDIKPSKEIKAK